MSRAALVARAGKARGRGARTASFTGEMPSAVGRKFLKEKRPIVKIGLKKVPA